MSLKLIDKTPSIPALFSKIIEVDREIQSLKRLPIIPMNRMQELYNEKHYLRISAEKFIQSQKG